MDTNIILPEDFYTSYFYTGSSVICNPPVTNTDIDIMFLTDDKKTFEKELQEAGWYPCGDEAYVGIVEDVWSAWKKGELNYLVTDNKEYYDQFFAATKDAMEQNLLVKDDRIKLFDKYLAKFKKDLTPEQKQYILEVKNNKWACEDVIIDSHLSQPELTFDQEYFYTPGLVRWSLTQEWLVNHNQAL